MAHPVITMDKIVGMASAIHKALETVRENKEECRAIEQRVRLISHMLPLLKRQEMVKNRVMCGALEDIHDAIARTLEVVTACQVSKSNFLRLSCVGKLAKQLRQVQDDRVQKTLLLVFASSVCDFIAEYKASPVSSIPPSRPSAPQSRPQVAAAADGNLSSSSYPHGHLPPSPSHRLAAYIPPPTHPSRRLRPPLLPS